MVTGLVDGSAALASDFLGSIPGLGPIFRAALTVVVLANTIILIAVLSIIHVDLLCIYTLYIFKL